MSRDQKWKSCIGQTPSSTERISCSEFDRTYFLFLQQSTSWISYHSNPQVRNIPQLTFSYKASFKQFFFCGKQIAKAIFQLFFFCFSCSVLFVLLVLFCFWSAHCMPSITWSLYYRLEVFNILKLSRTWKKERKKEQYVCQKLQQVFEVQSFGVHTCPRSFCQQFIALSIIRCLNSAQKFAARVCQVAAVVMEITQLVLSQFKNFLPHQRRIE